MSVSEQARGSSQVAIVGGAPSRSLAPYDDPTWDIWAFSSLKLHTPRISRWFEMHAVGDLKSQLTHETSVRHGFRGYWRFLSELDCPVYMQRSHPAIPTSVKYPLGRALHAFGRCFTSTASYMIALAILEGYDTIGLWGIHLTARSVYVRQRPGVEYLLGVAKQKGVTVYIPPGCSIRVPQRPILTPTKVLYGYDWLSPDAWWRRKARRGAGDRARPKRRPYAHR